jgi:hypothetical protein
VYNPSPIEEEELISIRKQREKLRAQILSLKPDTISSYDDVYEDERLKKSKPFDVYAHTIPSLHLPSTPQLASPQAIQSTLSGAQDRILKMSLQLAQAQIKDPKATQPLPLDETTQSPLKSVKPENSDLNIDKEVFSRINSLRLLRNEMMGLVYHLVNKKLQSNKALFEEQKNVEDYIKSKAKTSEILEWVQAGSSVAMVIISVGAFAASIASAGLLGGVVDSLRVIPSVVNGVVGASNGMTKLQMKEKEGIALELKEIRTMEHEKVQTLLGDNQAILARINDLMRSAALLARHMSEVKFF